MKCVTGSRLFCPGELDARVSSDTAERQRASSAVGSGSRWRVLRHWRASHLPSVYGWSFIPVRSPFGGRRLSLCVFFIHPGSTLHFTLVLSVLLRLFSLRLHRRAAGSADAYGSPVWVWMDRRGAHDTCSAASLTPFSPCSSSSSSVQWDASPQPQTVKEELGGYMGHLLDFNYPVFANLCPGWGRNMSCWKPPGPGMSPSWRNC